MSLSRVTTRGSRGEDCLPRVGDLGHEPVGVVRRVAGRLDPAVGQSDGEGAADVAGSVLGLGLPEVGLAVVVGDAVLVGVGLGDLLGDDHRGGRVLGGGDGHKGEGGYQLKVKISFDEIEAVLKL